VSGTPCRHCQKQSRQRQRNDEQCERHPNRNNMTDPMQQPSSSAGLQLVLGTGAFALCFAVFGSLRPAGYTKYQEGKGGEALRSFQLVQPDLIHLDLYLPDIDGKEVIRRLRRRASRPLSLFRCETGKPRSFTLLLQGPSFILGWHLGQCKVSKMRLAKGSGSETRSLLSPPRDIQ
jgi:hypothetical protein